jgi:hypothetical protein
MLLEPADLSVSEKMKWQKKQAIGLNINGKYLFHVSILLDFLDCYTVRNDSSSPSFAS